MPSPCDDLGFESLADIHLLEVIVLLIQLPEAGHEIGFHAIEFGMPLVKACNTDIILAIQFRNRRTRLALLEDNDLPIAKA